MDDTLWSWSATSQALDWSVKIIINWDHFLHFLLQWYSKVVSCDTNYSWGMNTMSERTLPELPENLEEFWTSHMGVIWEFSAGTDCWRDCCRSNHPLSPEISWRVNGKKTKDGKRCVTKTGPTRVNRECVKRFSPSGISGSGRVEKFIALSLLAYALLDDRDKTRCMDTAILDYYHKTWRTRINHWHMQQHLLKCGELRQTVNHINTGL